MKIKILTFLLFANCFISNSYCKVSYLIYLAIISRSLSFCRFSSCNFLSISIIRLSMSLPNSSLSLFLLCISRVCWLSMSVTSLYFCFFKLASASFFFSASKSYNRVRIDHSSMPSANLIFLWAFLAVVVYEGAGKGDGAYPIYYYCYCCILISSIVTPSSLGLISALLPGIGLIILLPTLCMSDPCLLLKTYGLLN